MSTPSRNASYIRDALADAANDLFISSVTIWEISIKCAAGRLAFPIDEFDIVATRLMAASLPITAAHALVAGALPRLHGDPFDRMLIAQAQVEDLTLVTNDAAITRYPVRILTAPVG